MDFIVFSYRFIISVKYFRITIGGRKIKVLK